MNDFEETQKLVRLKRYERPPEGYFEGFLEEFHERQRAEIVKRSSRSLFFERLGTYFSDFTSSRLVFAGGAFAAAVLAVLVANPPQGGAPKTDATAGLPPDFDAPQGQVTPVSASPLLAPEVDLLDERFEGLLDDTRRPAFQVEPLPGTDVKTEIFEL